MNGVAAALAFLEQCGVPAGTIEQLRHAWFSAGGRYCAVTLDNYQSYIVDLEQRRYLHYPRASAAGFDGDVAIMSPDEVRFNLLSFDDDLRVDLRSDLQPWSTCAQ